MKSGGCITILRANDRLSLHHRLHPALVRGESTLGARVSRHAGHATLSSWTLAGPGAAYPFFSSNGPTAVMRAAGRKRFLPACTMHWLAVMNTAEQLNESYGAAHRSTFGVAQELTDEDPSAHRHDVEIDATIRVSGRELRAMVCRVRSLSVGGAVIEFDRLPVGTLTNITFGLPSVDKRLSLDAIVQCCTREGVTVLFDSPRAWEIGVLWRYLVSLDSLEALDASDSMDEDAEFESTRMVSVEQMSTQP